MTRRLSQIDIPARFAGLAPAWLVQFIVGLITAGVAMGLRAVLETLANGVIPFALMFPALLIATLVAGWQAGAFSTVLGGLYVWYFSYGQGSFATPPVNNIISLCLYAFSSSIIIAVAEAYRRSARALAVERAQQTLLINELNHRVKNTLATVQSLAAVSLGRDAAAGAARQAFEGRLFALSRAHDVLTRNAWESAGLTDVVNQAVAPFNQPGKMEVAGPPVQLAPHQALGLSMALHELATNAVKYGALSNGDGRVRITWSVEGAALKVQWMEHGGPAVSPPTHRGFGSRLLERGLARELDGEVKLVFEPTGLVCDLTAKLSAAAVSASAASAPSR